MRWLVLLLFSGCGPPVRRAPVAPEAPVFDAVSGEQHRRLFNLRGAVATQTTVRVFADTACAGPVYRQVSAADFTQGVPIELLTDIDNVFSANAVSSVGATSACSAPVRLRYVPVPRPGRPSAVSHPDSPSWQTHFMLAGSSDQSASVRLHANSCSNPVLGELSATDFFSPGFPVDVPVNGSRQFAIDALSEDQTSDCEFVRVASDQVPPVFTTRLGSPTPSPQQRGWVVIEGDMSFFSVKASPDCTGPNLTACFNCNRLEVEFPPDASTRWTVS